MAWVSTYARTNLAIDRLAVETAMSWVCTWSGECEDETLIGELRQSVVGTVSEEEISVAINRLIREPHFRVAARRLGVAIAADCNSSHLAAYLRTPSQFRVSTNS
jgi:hypothetical protein